MLHPPQPDASGCQHLPILIFGWIKIRITLCATPTQQVLFRLLRTTVRRGSDKYFFRIQKNKRVHLIKMHQCFCLIMFSNVFFNTSNIVIAFRYLFRISVRKTKCSVPKNMVGSIRRRLNGNCFKHMHAPPHQLFCVPDMTAFYSFCPELCLPIDDSFINFDLNC